MPKSNFFTLMDHLFLLYNIKARNLVAFIRLKDYESHQLVNKVKNLKRSNLTEYDKVFCHFEKKYRSQNVSDIAQYLKDHDFNIRFDAERNEHTIEIDQKLQGSIASMKLFLKRNNKNKSTFNISILNTPTDDYEMDLPRNRENWTLIQTLCLIMCYHRYENQWSRAFAYCSTFDEDVFHNKNNKQIRDRFITIKKIMENEALKQYQADDDSNITKFLSDCNNWLTQVMEIYALKFLKICKKTNVMVSFSEIVKFMTNDEGIVSVVKSRERVSEEDIDNILILLPRTFKHPNLFAGMDNVYMKNEFVNSFTHFFKFIGTQIKKTFPHTTKVTVKVISDPDELEDNDDTHDQNFSSTTTTDKSNMDLRSQSLSFNQSKSKSNMNLRSRT